MSPYLARPIRSLAEARAARAKSFLLMDRVTISGRGAGRVVGVIASTPAEYVIALDGGGSLRCDGGILAREICPPPVDHEDDRGMAS